MMKKNLIVLNLILCMLTVLCGCDFNLPLMASRDEEDHVKAEIEYYHTEKADNSVDITQDNSESDQSETDREDTLVDITQSDTLTSDGDDYDGKIFYREAASPDEVTLSFAGDFCLTEGCSVLSYIKHHDNDPKNSFNEELYNRMVDSDIFMLNNEYPYSTRGEALADKLYTFRADPADASLLMGFGVDIVSLANNHVYDYGETALNDTLDTLAGIDMPYVGAGRNIEEASRPAYFNINGKTIAIVSATQIEGYANPETKEATETSSGVFRCLDTTRLKAVIAEARANSDYVIFFVHWGTELVVDIRDWQVSTARDAIEAGADLIIGAHPHILQGIDYIEGKPVFYSLGNYLFNSNTLDTALVTLTLDTSCADAVDVKSIEFIPCIQGGGQTVEASGSDWNRIIDYENSLCMGAYVDYDGYVSSR